MRILIAGGGTGGHLVPGIALYEELKKRGIECRYVLREQDLKYAVSQRIAPEDRMEVNISGISRKFSLKTPVHVLKLGGAFLSLSRKIRRWKPTAVLITGGYVSNPVALAARFSRKPLFIAEQNSVAGVTNRVYAPYARIVFTSFPVTHKIRSQRVLFTGNPSIFRERAERGEAAAFFGLNRYEKIIGVTGGSQGAQFVNDAVTAILPFLDKKRIGLVWSMGAVDYDRLEQNGTLREVEEKYKGVRVFRFIDRMDYFFSCADLVITRGGATSIAEIIHFGTPPILIPITNSPDNHQLINSRYIADNAGGEVLEEKEVNTGSLQETIQSMYREIKRYRMSLDLLRIDNPAEKIIDAMIMAIEDER